MHGLDTHPLAGLAIAEVTEVSTVVFPARQHFVANYGARVLAEGIASSAQIKIFIANSGHTRSLLAEQQISVHLCFWQDLNLLQTRLHLKLSIFAISS